MPIAKLRGPWETEPVPSRRLTHGDRMQVTVSLKNPPPHPNPGLCGHCTHARRIESDRGSQFLLCQLAATDSRFAKYPRLPVLCCEGYEMGPTMHLTAI
jgi:hypothetical protein